MGSLQFWSVGGTEESKWVEFFLLNPPEMTRQFSLAAWGTVLVAMSSRISVYLGSLVTKKRAACVCHSHFTLQIVSFGLGNVICGLPVAQ